MCERDIWGYVAYSDARVDELFEILEIERVARYWVDDFVPPRPEVEQRPDEKEKYKNCVNDTGGIEI